MQHNLNEDNGQSPGAIDICPVCDAIGMLCNHYSTYRLCKHYELICIMAQLINYLFIQLRNVQRRHFIMEGFVVTAVERFFEGPIKIPRLLLSSAELPHMAYIWDCLRPCHQTEKLLSLSPNHQNNVVMTSLQNVNVNITDCNVVLKSVVKKFSRISYIDR